MALSRTIQRCCITLWWSTVAMALVRSTARTILHQGWGVRFRTSGAQAKHSKDSAPHTGAERSLLRPLVFSGTAATRKLTHVRILLLADASLDGPARTDADIEQALGGGA